MTEDDEGRARVRSPGSPRRIGRYHVCFELASGGMATVYLARLEGAGGFKKLVALKRIHPHLVGQEGFVEMFLDEARLASRIDHPNVCGVFDFGFGDDSYYIAMEFLVGETVARLLQLVRKVPELSPMPAHAFFAARIIADAALGLHAAHELRGDDGRFLDVVHRDVSPQNLMVTYDGVAKVMDFGIAFATDQLHHTRTGTVRGKFAYMSPEQLDGRAIDRRADVWSLGVVLWELLTGKPLFSGLSEPEAIRAVVGGPIPSPSSARSGIPHELDAIVARCLSRSREERWATAEELARTLGEVRSRKVSPVTAPSLGEWMRDLFPDLYGRRLELVDQARQTEDDAVPRVSRMLSEPGIETRRTTAPLAEKPPRGGPSRRVLAGGAAALLGLGGVAAAFTLGGSKDDAGATPSSEPQGPRTPSSEPSATAATSPPASTSVMAAVPSAEASPVGEAPSSAPAPLPAASVVPAPNRPPRSPSPSAPDPALAGKTGTIDVATPGGWADVYVGGRGHGRTPLRLTLPAGKAVIVLRPFGSAKSERHGVTVTPNAAGRLVVPVTPPRPATRP